MSGERLEEAFMAAPAWAGLVIVASVGLGALATIICLSFGIVLYPTVALPLLAAGWLIVLAAAAWRLWRSYRDTAEDAP